LDPKSGLKNDIAAYNIPSKQTQSSCSGDGILMRFFYLQNSTDSFPKTVILSLWHRTSLKLRNFPK